jgi:CO dehydrogenase/acetyl-CoA synthase epsilon subunit
MKIGILILLILVIMLNIVYSQNIDFVRLGNEIQPLLGRNFFEKSQSSMIRQNKLLGILGQDSKWLGLNSRQSLDLVMFFMDKKQYTSFLYSSPYSKNKELVFNYQRLLNKNFMLGTEIKYKIQSFPEDKVSRILTIGVNAMARMHENHHLYVKYARNIYSTPFDKMAFILFGIDNKIGKYNHLNIFYTYLGHQMFNGIRGNISSSFKLFEGDIGWEPLPYSFTFGLAYNLPKSIKFGLKVRQHQWLGNLTTVFFQKQWNYKVK